MWRRAPGRTLKASLKEERMRRPRLQTVLTIERETFRAALRLVVIVAAVVVVLPRLVDLAAAAFR